MDVDERIERLTVHQEKTQVVLAEIVDTLKRLERVALAHVRLQDNEAVLAALEDKAKRRPQ